MFQYNQYKKLKKKKNYIKTTVIASSKTTHFVSLNFQITYVQHSFLSDIFNFLGPQWNLITKSHCTYLSKIYHRPGGDCTDNHFNLVES